MSKPKYDGKQQISKGMVKNRHLGYVEWHSIEQEGLVQLESDDWVTPEMAEELTQHLAERKKSRGEPTPKPWPALALAPSSTYLY